MSLLQSERSESASAVSKSALEGFIEENHKRIKRLGDGNFDSCSLEKDETESVKAEARQILGSSKNRELDGTDEKIVENDIETRERALDETNVGVE